MPEIGTSGLMSGKGKQTMPLKALLPRLFPTLLAHPGTDGNAAQSGSGPASRCASSAAGAWSPIASRTIGRLECSIDAQDRDGLRGGSLAKDGSEIDWPSVASLELRMDHAKLESHDDKGAPELASIDARFRWSEGIKELADLREGAACRFRMPGRQHSMVERLPHAAMLPAAGGVAALERFPRQVGSLPDKSNARCLQVNAVSDMVGD